MTETLISPVHLIHHLRHERPSFDDALFLTFNHDLSFFEREVLGPLQETGSRITILGDAYVTQQDAYAVRHAGISYLSALASGSQSFHPKLIVLVGRDEALVSIGSGNLTLAGWRGNDELWSHHRTWREGGSSVSSQVGSFLAELPEVVRLVPEVAEILQRVSSTLSEFSGTDDSHTVVSSLSTPIIDQLPHGPVDELLLYAPFHDPAASAIHQLIERFSPSQVRIAYQPESTHIAGSTVVDLVNGRGEMYPIPNHPYRHGKLIEWRVGTDRRALTGSPNLSAAALLRSARSGGNVEIAVISSVSDSLMPSRGSDSDADSTLPVFPQRKHQSRVRDVILAAVVDDNGLRVTMARPLSAEATVEFFSQRESTERWQLAGVFSAGQTVLQIGAQVDAGARVRVTFSNGITTPIVFATSFESVSNPRSAGPTGPKIPMIGQVPNLADATAEFWRSVRAGSSQVLAPLRVVDGSMSRESSNDGSSTRGDWASYLDRCQGQLGLELMAFALGYPEPGRSFRKVARSVDWDSEEVIDDEVGLLEDDSADMELPNDGVVESDRAIEIRINDAKRGKCRKVAELIADEALTALPHETVIAIRLILNLASENECGSPDWPWTDLVLRAIAALEEIEGDELSTAAGSVSALALSIVDYQYGISTQQVDRSLFRQVVEKVRHLLIMADGDRVAEYSRDLGRFSRSTGTSDVLAFRDLLVNDNPVDLMRKDLQDAGIAYTKRGHLLLLDEETSNPLEYAKEVASIARSLETVAIRAPGRKSNQWAAFIRSSVDQVEIRTGSLPRSVMVDHFHANEDGWSQIVRTNAREPLPEVTSAVLGRLGLSIDDLHDV